MVWDSNVLVEDCTVHGKGYRQPAKHMLGAAANPLTNSAALESCHACMHHVDSA